MMLRCRTPLAKTSTPPVTLTGEFTLRSGQVSSEYFDKYLFESEPCLLRRVAEAMATLLPPCDVLASHLHTDVPPRPCMT